MRDSVLVSSAVAGLLLASLIFAPRLAAREGTSDDERLQGTWKVVAEERDGRPQSDGQLGSLYTFDGETLTVRMPGNESPLRVAYRLRQEGTIGQIDFEVGGNGMRIAGIYKLEGETLKLCTASGAAHAPRPTAFQTTARSGWEVGVLKRVGPAR